MLKIKQDDKFYSRLLSKESSIANSSFRVYYGGQSGAVPFTWESQPGTPKHKFSDNFIPPLTPPPSFYSPQKEKPNKKIPRSKFLQALLSRMNPKKAHQIPSSPSSSSSSWSTSSTLSTPSHAYRESRRRFLSFESSFDDGEDISVPSSMLCFGINRVNSGGY